VPGAVSYHSSAIPSSYDTGAPLGWVAARSASSDSPHSSTTGYRRGCIWFAHECRVRCRIATIATAAEELHAAGDKLAHAVLLDLLVFGDAILEPGPAHLTSQ
jgi:hypothetical protein